MESWEQRNRRNLENLSSRIEPLYEFDLAPVSNAASAAENDAREECSISAFDEQFGVRRVKVAQLFNDAAVLEQLGVLQQFSDRVQRQLYAVDVRPL